jgi:hypothetical protein
MAMLGLVLLYVGAVLIINGLTMLGRISPREATIMNIFTGVVCVSVSAHNAFGSGDDMAIKNAALGLLFGFTYLWVAFNNVTENDGRGLGWFSLFVALTALPIFVMEMSTAETVGQQWLALNWGAWAVLWASFFALNVLKKKKWTSMVGGLAILEGVVTAWIPGFLLLVGKMPGI